MASLFQAPSTPKPVAIPDRDSPAALEARKKRLDDLAASGGRESTARVPTMGDYMGKVLGGGSNSG